MQISLYQFFEQYFKNSELSSFEDIFDTILKWSPSKILEFLDETSEYLRPKQTVHTNYSFIADTRLSGLPSYCWHQNCRIKSLHSLAEFAVLYSDITYVVCPFDFAIGFFPTIVNEQTHNNFATHAAFAVFASLVIRPLLERGLIVFCDFRDQPYCTDCLANILEEFDKGPNYHRQLFDFFHNTTKSEVIYLEQAQEKVIRISYDEIHGEHVGYWEDSENKLEKFPVGHTLNRSELIEVGHFTADINILTHDFVTKNMLADKNEVEHIFSNPAELSYVTNVAKASRGFKELEFEYPIFAAMNFTDALKIRDQEWHHLSDFRDAIDDLKKGQALSDKDMAGYFRSEISKIYKVLQKSNREANGTLVDAAAFAAFSITASVVTSGYSNLFAAATGVLGSGHAVKEALPAIRKKMSIPEEARTSRYFYAWRIGKAFSRPH